jgi:hypothetical protein
MADLSPVMIEGQEATGDESGNPSGSSVTAISKKKDISPTVHLLDKNQNPLVVFTKKIGKRSLINPQFRWQEDVFEPKFALISGAVATALNGGGTTVTLQAGNEDYLTVGDLLIFPGSAGTNAGYTYDEIVRVITRTTSTSFEVQRNFSSVRAGEADGTPGNGTIQGDGTSATQAYILGTAFAEGSSPADAKATKVQYVGNFAEIFKDTVEVSKTLDVTELYSGQERARQRAKKALKHMRDIERAFIQHQPNEDVSGNTATRSTGGINYWIQSNVNNVNGTMNYATWTDFIAEVFRYGSTNSRLLIVSRAVSVAIDLMAHNEYFTFEPANVYGVDVMKITSASGTLLVVRHKMLEEMGLPGWAAAIDLEDVKYCYMKGRDTFMETNIQLPGDDKFKDQYISEVGLEFPLEQRHGKLVGVTGFAP